MAGVDYGAVVKINGRIVNWGMDLYPRMADVVGFSIPEVDVSYSIGGQFVESYREIDGKYNYYMGDDSFMVAVYKDFVTILENGQLNDEFCHLRMNIEDDGALYLVGGIGIEMERIDEGPRVFTRFSYKGNDYEILHGYLVDHCYTDWIDEYVEVAHRELIREWLRDGGIDA